jgi:hypothetical protein
LSFPDDESEAWKDAHSAYIAFEDRRAHLRLLIVAGTT